MTGGNEITKKALLSWDKVCYPKNVGGFNVPDLRIWNRAAMRIHLWNLAQKKVMDCMGTYLLHKTVVYLGSSCSSTFMDGENNFEG